MKKFAVVTALEGVAEARKAWTLARRGFDTDLTYVMNRLIHEAAVNFMSVGDIAKASGLTRRRVIDLMHANGLRTSMGKRLLAETAAEALATNSALLGIDPHEMDLMSPLAYLPMGSQMKRFLETPVDVEEALGEKGPHAELDRARRILAHVMFLRLHGEGNLPGETWEEVDTEVETYLREAAGDVLPASDAT